VSTSPVYTQVIGSAFEFSTKRTLSIACILVSVRGAAGALILFSCGGEPCEFQNSSSAVTGAITDSGGHYSVGVLSGHKESLVVHLPDW
jgi:hypothetical protein